MDKISRGNYELEINDNSEDELSSLKNSLYKIMVYMKEQADSARIKKVMLVCIGHITPVKDTAYFNAGSIG